MIKLDQATFCFKGTSFRWLEVKSNFFRAEKKKSLSIGKVWSETTPGQLAPIKGLKDEI